MRKNGATEEEIRFLLGRVDGLSQV
jgi:hypothetical protein